MAEAQNSIAIATVNSDALLPRNSPTIHNDGMGAGAKRKPLTAEQLADAARLKSEWLAYKSTHQHATQEWVAKQCGWAGQPAFFQYLGKVPLNLDALIKFAGLFGIQPERISPTLALRLPGEVRDPAGLIRDTPVLDAFRFSQAERAEIARHIRARINHHGITPSKLGVLMGISTADAYHVTEYGTESLPVLKRLLDVLPATDGKKESMDYVIWGLARYAVPLDGPQLEHIEAARRRTRGQKHPHLK